MREIKIEIIEQGAFKPSCEFYRGTLTFKSDRPVSIKGCVTSKGLGKEGILAKNPTKFGKWSDILKWSNKLEPDCLVVVFDYDSTLYFCNVVGDTPFIYPFNMSVNSFDGLSLYCLFEQNTGVVKLMGTETNLETITCSKEEDLDKLCAFYVETYINQELLLSVYPNSSDYDVRNYAAFYKNMTDYAIILDEALSEDLFDKVIARKPSVFNPILSTFANNTIDEMSVKRVDRVEADIEEYVTEEDEEYYDEWEDSDYEEPVPFDSIVPNTAVFLPKDKSVVYNMFEHIALVKYLNSLQRGSSDVEEYEDDEEDVYLFDDDFEDDEFEDDDEEVATINPYIDCLTTLVIAANGLQSSDALLAMDKTDITTGLCNKCSGVYNEIIAELQNNNEACIDKVRNAFKNEYTSIFSLATYFKLGMSLNGDSAFLSTCLDGFADKNNLSAGALCCVIENFMGTNYVEKYKPCLYIDHLKNIADKTVKNFKYPYEYNNTHKLDDMLLLSFALRSIDKIDEHHFMLDLYNLVAGPNVKDMKKGKPRKVVDLYASSPVTMIARYGENSGEHMARYFTDMRNIGESCKDMTNYRNGWHTMCQVNNVDYALFNRDHCDAPEVHYELMLSLATLTHPFMYWVPRKGDSIDCNGTDLVASSIAKAMQDLRCTVLYALFSVYNLSGYSEGRRGSGEIDTRQLKMILLGIVKGFANEPVESIKTFIDCYKLLLAKFDDELSKAENTLAGVQSFTKHLRVAVYLNEYRKEALHYKKYEVPLRPLWRDSFGKFGLKDTYIQKVDNDGWYIFRNSSPSGGHSDIDTYLTAQRKLPLMLEGITEGIDFVKKIEALTDILYERIISIDEKYKLGLEPISFTGLWGNLYTKISHTRLFYDAFEVGKMSELCMSRHASWLCYMLQDIEDFKSEQSILNFIKRYLFVSLSPKIVKESICVVNTRKDDNHWNRYLDNIDCDICKINTMQLLEYYAEHWDTVSDVRDGLLNKDELYKLLHEQTLKIDDHIIDGVSVVYTDKIGIEGDLSGFVRCIEEIQKAVASAYLQEGMIFTADPELAKKLSDKYFVGWRSAVNAVFMQAIKQLKGKGIDLSSIKTKGDLATVKSNIKNSVDELKSAQKF